MLCHDARAVVLRQILQEFFNLVFQFTISNFEDDLNLRGSKSMLES